ncbi:PREDICTED: proline and serine-rich protein 2 [Gekko japonicus]|uniref:Proline and serine-rich protein 2 n=1 Tax=Gekko japonicus TaxID=146911 RepID=A0ABM1L0N9_GEKJA|nr:PREDICTED: proline and serine-rich protein 2 [Gekko japonicus]
MPRNMMSDFSGMVCELSPKCQFGNFGKSSGPLENGKGRPRRTNSTLEEDETLRYLSHEEKDVLLFFEETIGALEDDLEEQGLRRHSPRSMQEIASSHSEPEEIIDLVRPVPENSSRYFVHSRHMEAGLEEVWKRDKHRLEHNGAPDGNVPADAVILPSVLPSAPPLPIYEGYPAAVPAQHPRLLRSVPTPLVIAQKMSENHGEGSSFSPVSPKEKLAERRTPTSSPKCNGGRFVALKPSVPPPTAPKPQRFPSNISLTNLSEREFCKTITRAAVNVQERKAQVLANVNGSAILISELEERLQKHEFSSPARSSSVKDLSSEQARHEALSKLGLVEETLVQAESEPEKSPSVPAPKDERPEEAPALSNGYRNIHDILKQEPSPFPSVSKTVTFKPDAALLEGKLARQNTTKSFYDQRQSDFAMEIRKRSGSLPRPSGLRPQGVTVQFSGRGSTEEARREALRKLGLLKE